RVSRGGYLGGSTIAGRWSDTRDFPGFQRPDKSVHPPLIVRRKRSKAERRRLREQAALAKASALGLTCKDALAFVGRPPLPKKLSAKGEALKALVTEGFLLPTGQPNPEHPQLRVWVKSIEKSKA